MKYCHENGKLDFNASGSIGSQAEGLVPWYRLPDRLTSNLNIIFADDANFEDGSFPGIYSLPSQDKLTALNLATTERISVYI
jgi:bis(5'-nucleosyl)-tetraphosphatase (symmetrical)